MAASMLAALVFMGNDTLDRIPVDSFEPSAILEALEDRDDSEWQALGYASRSQFINAHLNGEI